MRLKTDKKENYIQQMARRERMISKTKTYEEAIMLLSDIKLLRVVVMIGDDKREMDNLVNAFYNTALDKVGKKYSKHPETVEWDVKKFIVRLDEYVERKKKKQNDSVRPKNNGEGN